METERCKTLKAAEIGNTGMTAIQSHIASKTTNAELAATSRRPAHDRFTIATMAVQRKIRYLEPKLHTMVGFRVVRSLTQFCNDYVCAWLGNNIYRHRMLDDNTHN